MPYIIDGHNLIPKIPQISLRDLDDEDQLVSLLQEFCRIRRKHAEVFFDNAPPGTAGVRNFGMVIARYIRQGDTADMAIRRKLKRLAGEARNWTVVSSDHDVQRSARSVRAKILSAETFAEQVLAALEGIPAMDQDIGDGIGPQDVETWMQLFGIDEDEDGES